MFAYWPIHLGEWKLENRYLKKIKLQSYGRRLHSLLTLTT